MKKLDTFLFRFQFVVAAAAFLGMVVLTCANVIVRLIFSKTLAWSEELTYAFFNWAVYIGICLVYKNQGMISVDVIVDRLPKKAQRIVMTCVHAFVLVLNACLTVWGMQLAIFAFRRTTPILKLPYFWIDLAIPVGCAMLTYYSARYLYMTLKGEEVAAAALEERS